MSRIDISVIVPCYNTERYLDQALSSAEQNDRCSLEIIAINDGSTDGSLSIMREHEARDSRVRVIDKENGGYGAGVNRGLADACGAYVAILEPDDYVLPHMYDTLVEVALRHGSPDMVKSPYLRVWMPDTSRERIYNCSYYRRIKPVDAPFALPACPRLIQHHPSIWSAIYRRGFLDERGIRFREVPGAGWVDNPFLIETCCQANPIVYVDEPFYCYREDLPGSSSALRTSELAFERWNDMMDVAEKLDVKDDGILQALYVIGFRYAGGAIDEGGLGDDEVRSMIVQMFQRMDPARVARIQTLSAAYKRTYFTVSGYEPRAFSDIPYLRGLIGEFVYSAKSNGPRFALTRVGLFMRRRAAERGFANPTRTRSASI